MLANLGFNTALSSPLMQALTLLRDTARTLHKSPALALDQVARAALSF